MVNPLTNERFGTLKGDPTGTIFYEKIPIDSHHHRRVSLRSARAVIPVIDCAHIGEDAENEVVNFAKWAKQELGTKPPPP
jgi:hypothetical protein